MYIYLKNSKELQSNLTLDRKSEDLLFILDYKGHVVCVSNPHSYPHVNTREAEVESMVMNNCFKDFFIKAVDITYPVFSQSRKKGIYNYGGAKAELKIVKEKTRLKVETASLDSLPDMVTLQEMIHAGSILPTVSYESRQIRRIKIFLNRFKK